MSNLRKRDRPGKAKRKLSVVVIVLLCITSIGLCFSFSSFANAFGSASGTSLSPPQLKPPQLNNVPGDSENSQNKVDTQAIQITNLLEFEDSYFYEPGNITKYYDGADLNSRMNYGKFEVSDGYLEFSPQAEDVGTVAGTKFGFFTNEKSTILNPKSIISNSVDYIVIDFEIWSDTGIMPDIRFHITSTENYDIQDSPLFSELKYVESENKFCLVSAVKGLEGEIMYSKSIEDITKPTHFTIFYEPSGIVTLYYKNGSYLISNSIYLEKDVFDFTFEIFDHEIQEKESLCIDNFCIATYGNGSGEYAGDIAEIKKQYGNNEIDISTCKDWVFYEKYNKE